MKAVWLVPSMLRPTERSRERERDSARERQRERERKREREREDVPQISHEIAPV